MSSKSPSLPSRLARCLVIAAVRLYQRTLSPDHGIPRVLYPYGYCRHEPTCSQYAIERLGCDGIVRGTPRILLRLLSCHPWARVKREKWDAAVRRALER